MENLENVSDDTLYIATDIESLFYPELIKFISNNIIKYEKYNTITYRIMIPKYGVIDEQKLKRLVKEKFKKETDNDFEELFSKVGKRDETEFIKKFNSFTITTEENIEKDITKSLLIIIERSVKIDKDYLLKEGPVLEVIRQMYKIYEEQFKPILTFH